MKMFFFSFGCDSIFRSKSPANPKYLNELTLYINGGRLFVVLDFKLVSTVGVNFVL